VLTPTRIDPRCMYEYEVIEMDRASLIWRQYRASVGLKPYPAKQCSSAHSHHQSYQLPLHHICKAIHFSCLLCFLYHPLHIFNSENFYLLVILCDICCFNSMTLLSSVLYGVLNCQVSSLIKVMTRRVHANELTDSESC